MFSLIVAHDQDFGIGKEGSIPWHCIADLKLFQYLTTTLINNYKKNAIVMGYNTWISLPKRPLPNRINIIISATHLPNPDEKNNDQIIFYKSPQDLLNAASTYIHFWIIGGESIYKWFLDQRLVSEIYITKIKGKHICDTFYVNNNQNHYSIKTLTDPKIDNILKHLDFYKYSLGLDYLIYENKEEQGLLDKIAEIINKGNLRGERTGTGTLAIFGGQLKFDLNSFPLMTSRPHSLHIIFEELMWVLRGQQDVRILEKKNINIWSANSTQEFINKQMLEIPLLEGNIGETYGYNMRSYQGNYDQLSNVLNLLNNNPTSRRIIISLYNPAGVKRASLPPCLCWYQFFVRNYNGINWLDCQAMNRSSDIVIAGGWNIASAALLTYILAATCNMKPGILTWVYGDAHIYLNNITSAKEIVKRTPQIYPKLYIKKILQSSHDIEKLEFADLKLVNYRPVKPQIDLAMNV